MHMRASGMAMVAAVTFTTAMSAQWSNRYPKVDGFGHHVYLEGFELPTLSNGPMGVAASPDGRWLAFSSRGYLWRFDIETGVATQLTSGSSFDFRPAWSPDGRHLVFVRDDRSDTAIMLLDLASGEERVLVDTDALDLDPQFSDERTVVFSSARAGTIDIWSVDLVTGDQEALIQRPGLAMRPQRTTRGWLYLHKNRGRETIRLQLTGRTDDIILADGSILSQTRPAVAPDGNLAAYNWPTQDGYELRLMHLDRPRATVLLTTSDGLPLAPAFNAAGDMVYFSEADGNERMQLKRIPVTGGRPEPVLVKQWQHSTPMGFVRVTTDGPVRLTGVDAAGHPVLPSAGMMSMEGEHGNVFFYSPGSILLRARTGRMTVTATRGLTTRPVSASVTVAEGETQEITLDLNDSWDAQASGYMSGDHHFHLNYGGSYQLDPNDLLPMMLGENLDVATPLVANLHNRFSHQDMFRLQRRRAPLYRFGQEVRSHFLGHVGLINTNTLHWPWVWGPGYEVYGADDRTNASVLAFAREQNGFAWYVHPYSGPDPFSTNGMGRVPVELVADGALGVMDGLELACLWSNEMGTTALWYRFLNVGRAIVPVAGTDVMNDYYHTMPVGVTRAYVRTGRNRSMTAYLAGLRAGRSFVTTGPILELTASTTDGDAHPGDVIARATRTTVRVDVTTVVPVDRVEIIVNGNVVASSPVGSREQQSLEYELETPVGGWVAARTVGGGPRWPATNNYTYAHTAPIWIGEVGSMDPSAASVAASELLRVMMVSTQRLRNSYADTPTPNLDAHFAEARAYLESLVRN